MWETEKFTREPPLKYELKEAKQLSCEERIKLLADLLQKGVDLDDEHAYNALANLLKNNKVADFTNIPFQNINGGQKIAIQKLNPKDDVYTVFATHAICNIAAFRVIPGRKIGIINNEWKYIESANNEKDVFYRNTEKANLHALAMELSNATCEIPQPKSIASAERKVVLPEENPHSEHIVKKGESLWKIVKEKYWLDNPTDIANVINKIISYSNKQDPKQRISTEMLFVGHVLYLPKIITFRKLKFTRVDEPIETREGKNK